MTQRPSTYTIGIGDKLSEKRVENILLKRKKEISNNVKDSIIEQESESIEEEVKCFNSYILNT